MEQMNQAYKVFTRICLNNWHYIDRKVLGLNESINFFTGHSGSGKSTVIDAMQIVLYANTTHCCSAVTIREPSRIYRR